MSPFPPARILVVDDELSLERLIKQRFRRQIKEKAFEFIFVRNGQEAIDLLPKFGSIDLILTDIRMPEMDGLTLLEKVKQIDPTLKSVVISAYSELKNIRTAMNRGAFDFLTKPIDFLDLEITINKTLAFVREIRYNQQQLQQAQQQLRYQAFYDSLTGLLNRNGLSAQLSDCIRAYQQSPQSRFALLMVHLDRYQTVKFTLGHKLGEQLLQEAGHRLRVCAPPSAAVARVGTAEFALLLNNSDTLETERTTTAIRLILEQPFVLEGVSVSSSTSIGIAYSRLDYSHPEDVLRAADTAMHSALLQTQGRTVLFDPQMQTAAVERLQLEADLQRAIGERLLHLNYQPIYSLNNEQLVGFEALVRWHRPSRGLVSPVDFIPIAEETGLILPLGEWVLQEAAKSLSQWLKEFPGIRPLTMSVNLSGMQLSSPQLVNRIEEILQVVDLGGTALKLEITETILMEKAGPASQLLAELKAREIQLCIDDFGTGYSSLSYLHRLPLDTLKIDREFINGMNADSKDFDIVETIISLAHSLGLDVIAEGIETQEQLHWLRELGCEQGQGFLFSRPMEAERVRQLLAGLSH